MLTIEVPQKAGTTTENKQQQAAQQASKEPKSTATLNHHLNQTTKELKEIAEKLQESLYVDNCVASVDSEEELKYFCNESQKLLQSAKFDLRGWKHTKFKETVLNQEENEDEVEVPLLGLSWNTVDDTLSCDFRKFKLEDEPITKGKYCP
ncbi:reverse transcriptase [Caerostris extrusa]|uniref:Reverse transcriptase n=1 Tax=Caerostris extrusa TaxID=172846 RepID=A0AAV4NAJ9_CAEEX|nr:reverse transcriptase [Caerostris extrusa]